MPKIGSEYRITVAIALRMTDFGTSFCGSTISSAAAVRELEAHVVEEQQRHDAEEDQRARDCDVRARDEVA